MDVFFNAPEGCDVKMLPSSVPACEAWCEGRLLGAVVTLGLLTEGRTEFLKGHMV